MTLILIAVGSNSGNAPAFDWKRQSMAFADLGSVEL
jgi:hypothetical protein